MPIKKISVFYAWQSTRPSNVNRNFIRIALEDAAKRITDDPSMGVKVVIDSDTKDVPGSPPVTQTILRKIADADIFAPDLTFVAKTDEGKRVPNPNVLFEYGYALHALKSEAMMPVMNTHFGPPEELPFDMGHLRHPTRYDLSSDISDSIRRAKRDELSATLEGNLRVIIQHVKDKARLGNPFVPQQAVRPPAFFFQPDEVLASFGNPVEQENCFKRDRAIYLRLYPASAEQPRVGRATIIEVARGLMPMKRVVSSMSQSNTWGAINLEPRGDGITNLTQAFSSGELWGVSEVPFQDREPNHLDALVAEADFKATLQNFHRTYEQVLKLQPPFTVEFGATGLLDRRLLVPSGGRPSQRRYSVPMQRDSLAFEAELSDFDWEEWQSALRDFMIELYDLAELHRDQVLTKEMVAANDLTPM